MQENINKRIEATIAKNAFRSGDMNLFRDLQDLASYIKSQTLKEVEEGIEKAKQARILILGSNHAGKVRSQGRVQGLNEALKILQALKVD